MAILASKWLSKLKALIHRRNSEIVDRHLQNLLKVLRPGILLTNIHEIQRRRNQRGQVSQLITYSIDLFSHYYKSGGEIEKLEHIQFREMCQQVKKAALRNRQFRNQVERLHLIGAKCGFIDDGESWKAIFAFQIIIPDFALSDLEKFAADAAGILTPAAREEAEEKFRIYILRNYHDDWEKNRGKYPNVGGSPYRPKEEWLGDT